MFGAVDIKLIAMKVVTAFQRTNPTITEETKISF